MGRGKPRALLGVGVLGIPGQSPGGDAEQEAGKKSS